MPIQVLGANPARVPQGQAYVEPTPSVEVTNAAGAVIAPPPAVRTFGLADVDINVPGRYQILYLSDDGAGEVTATRTVEVEALPAAAPAPAAQPATASSRRWFGEIVLPIFGTAILLGIVALAVWVACLMVGSLKNSATVAGNLDFGPNAKEVFKDHAGSLKAEVNWQVGPKLEASTETKKEISGAATLEPSKPEAGSEPERSPVATRPAREVITTPVAPIPTTNPARK